MTTPPLAPTPPMGWNSWNCLKGNVNQQAVMDIADAMVKLGLKDLGYEYVVLDDLWHGGRDADGRLFPHPERFPLGMKALADHIHALGLKFGIYSCAGEQTCARQPGSHRHEQIDAETFASWDVDFLKYDYCFAPDDLDAAIRRYTAMGKALQATGRPIMFSFCEWGPRSPWLWARKAGGHLWRVSFDVVDKWSSPRNNSNALGILTALDRMEGLENHAGPGGWNDPDMLIVGLHGKGAMEGGGCTMTEYRTQFAMWCMLAAPLMLGCDLRNLAKEDLELISNRDLIGLDQDPLGKQAFRVQRDGCGEVWLKPLQGGKAAVAFLNRAEHPHTLSATWKTLGLENRPAAVRDLWDQRELAVGDALSVELLPHETKVFMLA